MAVARHRRQKIELEITDDLTQLVRSWMDKVSKQLLKIDKAQKEILKKMSEVNDKIQELVDVATDLKADVTTLKTAFEAYIAANPTANVADLQAAIDNLKATDADVEAAIGEVNPTPPVV